MTKCSKVKVLLVGLAQPGCLPSGVGPLHNIDSFDLRFLGFKKLGIHRTISISKYDINSLEWAEVAVFLPGWKTNKSIRFMHNLAQILKIRIYYDIENVPPF